MSKIESLVTGTLTKDAELKRGSSGKEYVALVVKIATNGEKPLFCRANLFGDDCESIAKLKKGDAASLVGKLEIGIWQASDGPSPSLSMMAHRAISPSSRKPAQRRSELKPTQSIFKAAAEGQSIRSVPVGDLANDLPWGDE